MADETDTPASDEPTAKADKAKKAKKEAAPKGKAKGKGDKGKGDKGKKGKKGAPSGGPSVAGHPRAAAAVRRAKGAGGLASFVLTAWLSHHAGLSPSHVIERALPAGIAGYLITWGCAVTVWRQVVLAELRAAVELRSGAWTAGPGASGVTQAPPAGTDASTATNP